jgi:hypothetical protein
MRELLNAGETITAAAGLTRGTVFTFTKDVRVIGPRWTHRIPGNHFVFLEVSESGYTFSARNTRTGQMDDIMAEPWVMELIRIIGQAPQEKPDRCTCPCNCGAGRGA